MAGGACRHHLAGVLDRHTVLQQGCAQRSAALDFQAARLGAEIGMGQQMDDGHGVGMLKKASGQTVHGAAGQGFADGGVHALRGKAVGGSTQHGAGDAHLLDRRFGFQRVAQGEHGLANGF